MNLTILHINCSVAPCTTTHALQPWLHNPALQHLQYKPGIASDLCGLQAGPLSCTHPAVLAFTPSDYGIHTRHIFHNYQQVKRPISPEQSIRYDPAEAPRQIYPPSNLQLGSGGSSILSSRGDLRPGSGGGSVPGSRGDLRPGSGGGSALGSRGDLRPGSGGGGVLRSRGDLRPGSGGGSVLGSRGNLRPGSGGGSQGGCGSGGGGVLEGSRPGTPTWMSRPGTASSRPMSAVSNLASTQGLDHEVVRVRVVCVGGPWQGEFYF